MACLSGNFLAPTLARLSLGAGEQQRSALSCRLEQLSYRKILEGILMSRRKSRGLDDDSESDWSLSGDWQRVVSLMIAIGYVVVWPILLPPKSLSHLMAGALISILSLAAPLACIWFGDDIGEYYRDGTLFPEITGPSPGRFIRWGGRMLLLLPVVIVCLVWLLDFTYSK